MSILIKRAKIIDPQSPYHQQTKDIFIKDDQIVAIGDHLENPAHKTLEIENLHVSPGWVEMHSNFSDPGHEEREDLHSGSMAAAFGGFTSVALLPENTPPTDHKAAVEYFYNQAENLPVHLYPIGALSKAMRGQELAEIYDMIQAGAVAFSSGKSGATSAYFTKIALLYAREHKVPIISFPHMAELVKGGQMHEGKVSTYLGMKGIPTLVEEIAVMQDLKLAEYTQGRLHLAALSTLSGIDMVEEVRQKGLDITCSINLYSLALNDELLESYDSNFKVLPPLRNEDERTGLVEAFKNGKIDALAIDHQPYDIERKNCEFEYAAFGMAGLDTAFGVFGKYLASQGIGIEIWVEKIAIAPRKILGLPKIEIKEGSIAELSLFDPDVKWVYQKEEARSKAFNNPFYGMELKGKVWGIINKGGFVQG